MENRVIRRLYHGSGEDFDVFRYSGVRSTSALGQGYYTTPSLEKARQYGSFVMAFDVDVTDFLDWDNLTNEQLSKIKEVLMDNVPPENLSRFTEYKYEVVSLNADGLTRLKELQALTSDSGYDSVRAKVVTRSETPPEFEDINRRTHGVVRWKEGASLDGATLENLLNLSQEFAPEIASYMGYKGAMYGDEVSSYDAKLLTKVETVESPNLLAKAMLNAVSSNTHPSQNTYRKDKPLRMPSPV